MWLSNKELKAAYEIEHLKQYEPYEYYLDSSYNEIEQIIDNKGEHENVPLICYKEEDITLESENDEYRVYECDEYFIYESKKGVSSLAEKVELVTNGKKLNSDLIYSDTDHISKDGKRHTPFFKPDFSIDTFKCFDYYSEFYAIRKMKSKMDVMLLENISHVAKPLFHWNAENNAEEIAELHKNNNTSYLTDNLYLGCSELCDIKNKVGIIIPSKDNPRLIEICLEGIKNAKIKSGINTIKVVIIDNGSSDANREEITNVIQRTLDKNEPSGNSVNIGIETLFPVVEYRNKGLSVEYIYAPMEFNFSKMCNIGAEYAASNSNGYIEYLLFMNDDIEISDDLFILKLLYFARMEHVGAVGCKLLYPQDGNVIQHVGITCMKEAGPSHKLSTFSDDDLLYFGKNRGVHDVLAVTAACFLVSCEKYFKIGGFYDKMKVGYNDVDFCVSLYENGYLNVVNNDCTLIHHESISRGSDALSELKLKRLDEERNMLYSRHPFLLTDGDPFYNKNLAEDFLEYRVNVIPDYEKRSYESVLHNELKGKAIRLKKKLSSINNRTSNNSEIAHGTTFKHLHFSIDRVSKNRNYLEVSGWALINKKANYLYDSYVVITDKNNDTLVYSTAKVKREDVANIFPEATYSGISGFMSRIPLPSISLSEEEINGLNEGQLVADITVGVLVINKKTGKKYYAG